MKKNTLLPVVAAALLTAALILQTSCNLNAPRYGVLTIDFENGAARAIGANGLPELADSTMQIDITGSSIVPITKRLEKDEPKIISERLPIGAAVTVTVSIITPSAIWTGSAGRTIDAGDNELAVKLNKVIASMRPLLFSAIQGAYATPYTFKLNMSGIPLEITQQGSVNPTNEFFCTRDGKGRLYAAYHDGYNGFEIQRYTSEGSYDKQVDLTGGPAFNVKALTTDLKTGKVYAAEGGFIYEIKDDAAPPHTPKPNLIQDSGGGSYNAIAAYNGYLFAYDFNIKRLKMYKLNDTGTEVILPGYTTAQDPLKDIIRITGTPVVTHQSGECQDMFAYGNKVYIVFTIGAPYDTMNKIFYGGVLEYTYTEDGSMTESGRYGFGLMKKFIQHPLGTATVVYQFEGEPQDRFYGARRIIGFEDGVLYIADDGAIFSSQELVNDYKLIENKNRIAKLDTRSGTLTFENTNATWYREWRP